MTSEQLAANYLIENSYKIPPSSLLFLHLNTRCLRILSKEVCVKLTPF